MKKIKKTLSFLMISLAVFLTTSTVQASHFPLADVVEVKQGDTLYRIAKKYHTTVRDLLDLNDLKGNIIYPGQRLLLSEDGELLYKVMAGAFLDWDNAAKQQSFLAENEIKAIITKQVKDGKVLYRVQAGAFSNEENAQRQLRIVREAGVGDAYLLSSQPLTINGVTVGDDAETLLTNFGNPDKVTRQYNMESYYYQNDGAGVRTVLNMADGTIEEFTVYPEYLVKRNFPAVPFTKKQVIDRLGYPHKTEEVSCYESAVCTSWEYYLDGKQMTVRIDRVGDTVQFLKISR